MPELDSPHRLLAVVLDELSIRTGTADQEHERRVAIHDLIEENTFQVAGHRGPYRLRLALHDGKLAFDIRDPEDAPLVVHLLSLQPLRAILRDYLALCDSYVAAIRTATPAQIQTIDMGRRGLHNEAAERLAERLNGKIKADFDTMRRLFTLLTVLHVRG